MPGSFILVYKINDIQKLRYFWKMTWHSTRKTDSNCIHIYILNRVMEDLKCLQIQHTCKQQAKNEIKI